MADNTILNIGAGGDTIATKDVAGIKHELVMLEFSDGAGGTTEVSAADPLPVLATINTTGLSTEAKQDDEITLLTSIAGEDFATQTTLSALNTKVPAQGQAAMAASLPVVIANNQSSIPVTGTFFQATQPVSAAALPLPSGAATSANQQTNALTDAQLRATPVPISGTVTVDTSLLATAAKQDAQTALLTTIDGDTSNLDVALSTRLKPADTLAAVTTVGAVTAITNALPAGNNNIGDVDIASALPAGSNIIGNVRIDQTTPGTTNGVQVNAALPAGANAIGKLAANSGVDIGDVDVTTLPAITIAAAQTLANVTTVASVTQNPDIRQATASNLNAQVVGNIAHDSADSGNPVKMGMKALAMGTTPTEVTANDRTDWYSDRAGIPFVIGGHPNVICLRATYTAAQTDTAIITISAGSKIVVTRVTVTASAANTVNPSVIIGFGATTTPTTTGVVLSHPGVAPGSGVVEGNGAGILGCGADGEDLRITCDVPTSGRIDCVVSYYLIAS